MAIEDRLNEINSILGKRIKALRIEYGHTLQELADILDKGKSTLGNIENGRTLPSIRTFLKICEYYHTTPNDLLGYDSKRKK